MKEDLMENNFKDFYDTLKDNLNGYEEEYDSFIDYGPELYKLLCSCLDYEEVNSDLRLCISAAIAYYVVPMDVIPETIYGPYGYIDDIYISVFVLRKIAHELGYEFLQELWEDDEDIENIIEICFKESVEVLEDKVEDILTYVGLIN